MNTKFLKSVAAGVFGLSLIASCHHMKKHDEKCSGNCHEKKKEESHSKDSHNCASKGAKANKEVKGNNASKEVKTNGAANTTKSKK